MLGGDLNPHALRHTPLKRTCLPFHHPSVWRVNGKWLMVARKFLFAVRDLPLLLVIIIAILLKGSGALHEH